MDSAPPTEEVRSCPLCNSQDSKFLFWNFDRFYRLPGKFGLAECSECGLVRLSPRPVIEQIGFYYPKEDYYSYQTPGSIRDRGVLTTLRSAIRQAVLHSEFGYPTPSERLIPSTFEPIVARLFYNQGSYSLGRRLPRFVAGGRALDIGCGSGAFLNILKLNGWLVAGVDLSEDAAISAKDSFDIDVFVGSLEDAAFDRESFDYVHMSHSIEHLPNPIRTLETINSLLKPGGKLYIETPNIKSRNFERMKQYWMPLETPRHLFLFSPESLRAAVENAGLIVDKQLTTYKNFNHLSYRYQRDEAVGELLDRAQRPPFADILRGAADSLRFGVQRLYNDTRGDFLHFWATKTNGGK